MPRGPLRGPRPAADAVLLLRTRYNADVPIMRDTELYNEYAERLSRELVKYNVDWSFDIQSESLDRSEYMAGPLGSVIDERTLVDIEFKNNPSISIDDLDTLQGNLNTIVFESLERTGIKMQMTVGADITVIGKVEGSFGGPRPFASSELVMNVLYDDDPDLTLGHLESLVEEDTRENLAPKLGGSGLVDAVVERMDTPDPGFGNTRENNIKVTVFPRVDEIDAKRRNFIKATFRDIGREFGLTLRSVSISANGTRM